MTPRMELLQTGAAGDERLVEELASLINRAFALGESGLWAGGATRIAPAEVAAAIGAGEMLVARIEGRIAGCGHLRWLDSTTADLGLVSAAPELRGSGIGREIFRAAEELARSRGARTMQLELLVPSDGLHPEKERLREWYERLGYRIVRSAPFAEVAGQGAGPPAVPCEFLVFSKPLASG